MYNLITNHINTNLNTLLFLQLATVRLCLKVTDEKQHSFPNSLPLGLCLKVIDEGLSLVNWTYLFRNNVGTFFYG
ncbi:hypothetical protein C0J52_19189 [Blattella germanica]|nr:hypothetical protein C0J52_19189 [Blattella germanica]